MHARLVPWYRRASSGGLTAKEKSIKSIKWRPCAELATTNFQGSHESLNQVYPVPAPIIIILVFGETRRGGEHHAWFRTAVHF